MTVLKYCHLAANVYHVYHISLASKLAEMGSKHELEGTAEVNCFTGIRSSTNLNNKFKF